SLIPENNEVNYKYKNILVMHGTIGLNGSYNPMTENELGRYTYCALGHVHEYGGKKNPMINFAYSGSPIARNFNEEGEHGYITGHIDDMGVTHKFVPLNGRRFKTVTFDVTGIEINEELKTKIISTLRDEIERENLKMEDILRLVLVGESDLDINIEYLEDGLKNYYNIAEIQDKSEYPYDFEKLKNEMSLQGLFTNKMLGKYSSDELSEKALKRGLRALRSEYIK
ncbi:MAG: hypothetical protein QMB63_07535, partial [Clostridiaceae bacterium]